MIMTFDNPLEDKIESKEKEFEILNQLISFRTMQTDYLHEVNYDLFNDPINKEILKVLHSLDKLGKDININSVRTYIRSNTNPVQVSQLYDHLDIILSYDQQDTFENLMFDLDILRKNRILINEILGSAKNKFMNNEPIEDIINDITESIISMDPDKEERETLEDHVKNTMDAINDPDSHTDHIKTPWDEWNKQFGGIIKDRVYLIGGESGSGKTALVTDLIGGISETYPDDVAILFFSYEMAQKRIITRLMSRIVKFTETKINQRSRKLNPDELETIKAAAKKISKYPLEIVYKSLTDYQLKMKVRRFALKNKGKHLLIFLDHIGLVEGNHADLRVKTINTSKLMKSFARDYKASVFPLTQLKKELTDVNLAANKANFHRPNDSHIMESGSLKADSDIVALLWRPEMRYSHINYDGIDTWDVRGKLFILNYKNRDGQAPTDLIFGCDIKYSHLYNLDDPFSPQMTPAVKEELKQELAMMASMDMDGIGEGNLF